MVQIFYEGLNDHERGRVDNASGRTFIDRTIEKGISIIEKLADSCANHQGLNQNGRGAIQKHGGLIDVSAVENDMWKDKVKKEIRKVGKPVKELTQHMKNIMAPPSTSLSPANVSQQPSFLCSICESYDHANDICPTLE